MAVENRREMEIGLDKKRAPKNADEESERGHQKNQEKSHRSRRRENSKGFHPFGNQKRIIRMRHKSISQEKKLDLSSLFRSKAWAPRKTNKTKKGKDASPHPDNSQRPFQKKKKKTKESKRGRNATKRFEQQETLENQTSQNSTQLTRRRQLLRLEDRRHPPA